ncbi:unnamed protein product [Cuscuta europaea]|uniref:Uncharacterized protein n=1 Tax=Cuscuta europaea TaxID=41803 RepID=A0A9P0ZSE1_CUSEU|nr:unnamed protein product [Cuscuta europaea]
MFHETDMRTVGCDHLGFCFLCYKKFELDYLIDGAPPAPRLPSSAPQSPMYEDLELGWSFESVDENGGGVAVGCFVRQCQNCFYMFHGTDMRTVGCVHLGFCILCYQKFELDYIIDRAPPTPMLPSSVPLSPMYKDPELGRSFESVGDASGNAPGTPPTDLTDHVALRYSARTVCLNKRYFNADFVVGLDFGWLAK